MRYGIAKHRQFVEISHDEYVRAKEAVRYLFELLNLEERLDLVMGNFYEYESELLSIASRMMIYRDQDYYSMSDDRNCIGRRINNLLSACRLFLDQSGHLLTIIYGRESSQITFLKKEKNYQYDNKLGYRVMEAFRNHIQHRGAPIHSVYIAYETIESNEKSQLLHTFIPKIRIQTLEEEGFKTRVLKEITSTAINGEVDVRPLIRQYIESIGKLQEQIRVLVQKDVEKWEMVLSDIVTKAKKEMINLDADSSLYLVIEQDNGKLSDHITIFNDFIERRKKLEKKNSHFNNLAICFVTNGVIPKKI